MGSLTRESQSSPVGLDCPPVNSWDHPVSAPLVLGLQTHLFLTWMLGSILLHMLSLQARGPQSHNISPLVPLVDVRLFGKG